MNMDNEQFWKILEPLHAQAERFCRSLAGNRDDGDDLYQEALLIAMSKFDSLRELSAFRSWLYQIAINSFRNRIRKPWWRRRAEVDPVTLESYLSTDPSREYDSRRWLNRAMAVLSAEDRALVVLFEIEGWSVAELSSMFKKPEGTIKARLSRSRRKMRRRIEQYLSGEIKPMPRSMIKAISRR